MLLVPQDSKAPRTHADTFGRVCNLPRLSPGATRLLSVSAEADSALEEFEDIFGSDPSLTAELLRVANSAEFGLRAAVPNIKFALMLLGTERLRTLALTLALSRYTRFAGSSARPLRAHSIASAVIAEEIGRCLRVPAKHLYTAGLTHDFGRLGLLLTGGPQYTEALAKEYHSMEESSEVERVLFGMTHADAGAFLANAWQFPKILCDCVRRHHDLLTGLDDDLIRVTQAACVIAENVVGLREVNLAADAPRPGHSLETELADRPELEPVRLRNLIVEKIRLCGE